MEENLPAKLLRNRARIASHGHMVSKLNQVILTSFYLDRVCRWSRSLASQKRHVQNNALLVLIVYETRMIANTPL